MMTVYAKLFATLRRFRPDVKMGESIAVDLPEGATLADLIRQLELPEQEVKVVFVNGLFRTGEHRLAPGDEVGIFPPVGGG
jgi:molybdopterin converting factor small subunit